MRKVLLWIKSLYSSCYVFNNFELIQPVENMIVMQPTVDFVSEWRKEQSWTISGELSKQASKPEANITKLRTNEGSSRRTNYLQTKQGECVYVCTYVRMCVPSSLSCSLTRCMMMIISKLLLLLLLWLLALLLADWGNRQTDRQTGREGVECLLACCTANKAT